MSKRLLPVFSLFAILFSTVAQAFTTGDIAVRARGLYISPSPSTTTLSVDVKAQQVPEFDFSYFFSNNCSAELILGTARHEIYLGSNLLGKTSLLPPTLLAQYHLDVTEKFKPYVGVGLNYTLFYSVSLPSPLDISRGSIGPAFQLGGDFLLSDRTFINFDVKKIFIATDVLAAGATADTLHINPWIYGIGIGFKL